MTTTHPPVDPAGARQHPEAVQREVDLALATFDSYVAQIPGGPASWIHRRVLESDPQPSLGPAVLLASLDAEVCVASGEALRWNPDHHPIFYRALYERLRAERPMLSPDPIRSLLNAGAFVPEVLTTVGTLDDLSDLADGLFDLVASHSAVERAGNVPRLLAELARLTRPNGYGVHLIDYRDRRNPDRPLEHLTMAAEAFQELFLQTGGACGNRWRPSAIQCEAEAAGFDLLNNETGILAEDSYLDDLLPRLHADYSGLDRDGLRVLTGSLLMRKRRALNTEYPTENDNPQTLAHSLCRYSFTKPFVSGQRVLDVGCGAGLGTRELLVAGAASVVGLDVRPEALEIARAYDPQDLPEAWLQHDLEVGLPFPDASFDVVVALEVIEHVREQEQLIAEIQRVLTERGVAFISVPHRPFELFWTQLSGEPNPYHLHVPGRDEFEAMLSGFEVVELSAQIDMVSSLILPLTDEGEQGAPLQRGTLLVSEGTTLSERGSIVLIASASKDPSFRLSAPAPVAHAWGNHQESLGGAIQSNQDLNQWAETLRYERSEAVNRLRWGEYGDLPAAAC